MLTTRWRNEEACRRAHSKLMKDEDEERRNPTAAEIEGEMSAVPDYPELSVTYSKFSSCFCKCIKERTSTKCDCTICSYMSFNCERWNNARKKWGLCEANPECPCHNVNYQKASRSVNLMARFTMCQYLDDKEVNGPLAVATSETQQRTSTNLNPGQNEIDRDQDDNGSTAVDEFILGMPSCLVYFCFPLRSVLRLLFGLDTDAAVSQSGASSLDDWLKRSPRYMTLNDAGAPFQCFDWNCLNGDCQNKRYRSLLYRYLYINYVLTVLIFILTAADVVGTSIALERIRTTPTDGIDGKKEHVVLMRMAR